MLQLFVLVDPLCFYQKVRLLKMLALPVHRLNSDTKFWAFDQQDLRIMMLMYRHLLVRLFISTAMSTVVSCVSPCESENDQFKRLREMKTWEKMESSVILPCGDDWKIVSARDLKEQWLCTKCPMVNEISLSRKNCTACGAARPLGLLLLFNLFLLFSYRLYIIIIFYLISI